MTQDKVLVVDDETAICEVVQLGLETQDIEVHTSHSIAQMWSCLRREPGIDLIILDLGLPDGDGLDIMTDIRRQYSCGVIVLTGRGGADSRIEGLELGADDYIAKPFEMRELIARVKNVVRRLKHKSVQTETRAFAFDGWRFDAVTSQLSREGKDNIHLTQFESGLLLKLLEADGHPVSRDILMSVLAGRERHPLDRSMDNLVSRLRRKLCYDKNSMAHIKSVRGIGYQFACPVEALDA